jgi:IclR family pca regulon transcriptional regulator
MVRSQDHCVAHEEHEIGVHALAVPLRNQQGRTVAALNVVTTAARLGPTTIASHWLPLLHDAAREVRPLL